MDLVTFTAFLVLAYALLAGIDGIWTHLWRLRLYDRPETYGEHLLHTIRALLFPVILLLVLNVSTQGPLLWIGLLLVVIDFALVAWDAAIETRSRDSTEGLPADEAALHTILQALHAGAVACAIAARPWSAWPDDGTLPPVGALPHAIFQLVLVGSCVVAGLHLVLSGPAIRSLLVRSHHGKTTRLPG